MPNGKARFEPHISNLELVEEPTGREAIHAAVDAYLDAQEKCVWENRTLANTMAERNKNLEALKKLLNL